MFFGMTPFNFLSLVDFKHLQELSLSEATCFTSFLQDLEWVHMKQLQSLHYSVFFINQEQYAKLLHLIPQSFPGLLSLTLMLN